MESGEVGGAVGGATKGDESGSEETVVEHCPSQVTVETLQTTSSQNKSDATSSTSNETTPPPRTELILPTPPNEDLFERLTTSFKYLCHSPGLCKQEREGGASGLLPPPLRHLKIGPRIQGFYITVSSSSGVCCQASMGGGGSNPTTPSPLTLGNHKRHSSVRWVWPHNDGRGTIIFIFSVLSQREYLQDAASLSSGKTRVSE